MPLFEELFVQCEDYIVDPGFGTVGAAFYHLGKGRVDGDGKSGMPHCARQTARNMESVQRKDATPLRVDPEDLRVAAVFSHRKYPDGIAAQ